jgi:hypothetical protein
MMLLPMEFDLAIAFDSSENPVIKNTQFKIKKRAEARFLLHDQQSITNGSLRPLYQLVTIYICHHYGFYPLLL